MRSGVGAVDTRVACGGEGSSNGPGLITSHRLVKHLLLAYIKDDTSLGVFNWGLIRGHWLAGSHPTRLFKL